MTSPNQYRFPHLQSSLPQVLLSVFPAAAVASSTALGIPAPLVHT